MRAGLKVAYEQLSGRPVLQGTAEDDGSMRVGKRLLILELVQTESVIITNCTCTCTCSVNVHVNIHVHVSAKACTCKRGVIRNSVSSCYIWSLSFLLWGGDLETCLPPLISVSRMLQRPRFSPGTLAW